MLLALMNGTVRAAGELARMAGIAPSTASGHLNKLVEGGLVTVVDQGRHRYFALADEHVAHLLETLTVSDKPLRDPVRGNGDPVLRRAHLLRPSGRTPGGGVVRAITKRGFLGADRRCRAPERGGRATFTAGWLARRTNTASRSARAFVRRLD
ncbi:MAG: hypothetical protein ACI9DC_000344 [Gammaproteobacteria bacterium]|jgi:hypothetical protein